MTTEQESEKPIRPTGKLYDAIGAPWTTRVALVYDCGTVVLVDIRNGTAVPIAAIKSMREDVGELMMGAIVRCVRRATSTADKAASTL